MRLALLPAYLKRKNKLVKKNKDIQHWFEYLYFLV
jgi:hypothetical protein